MFVAWRGHRYRLSHDLLFVPIFLLFNTLVRRRLREIGRRENVLQRAKTRIVTETYRGYADIKIGGAMPLMVNSFDDCMNEIIGNNYFL